jgi:branched-chain amino acid aminotransferase
MQVSNHSKFMLHDGTLVPIGNAIISGDAGGFRYGYGFFETIRVVQGKILLWKYHVRRIEESLQLLQLTFPAHVTYESILKEIEVVIQKNYHSTARVRLTFYKGNGGVYDDVSNIVHRLVQSWELPKANLEFNSNGLDIGLYKDSCKPTGTWSHLKTNNYLLYALAAKWAKQHKWNDAIVLNQFGAIADATIANIWIVKNDVIYTPTIEDGGVSGTMRAFLLDQLKATNIEVQEKSLFIEDIMSADEVFLTNAIYGVRWVKQFEKTTYNLKWSMRIHTLTKPQNL